MYRTVGFVSCLLTQCIVAPLVVTSTLAVTVCGSDRSGATAPSSTSGSAGARMAPRSSADAGTVADQTDTAGDGVGDANQSAEERGAIVLSGDANIGSALIAGGEPIPFDPGNVTFFQNVLEMNAGSNVALSLNRAPASVINEVLSDIYQTYQDGGAAVSFIETGRISAATLGAVDLLVILLPNFDFTHAELTAMSDFLGGGGTVFFLGENTNFRPWNDRINATLEFLGSSMRIDNTVVGRAADRTANLAAHPVLFGVTDISFAVISTISGGMTLVSSELDEPFIAVD